MGGEQCGLGSSVDGVAVWVGSSVGAWGSSVGGEQCGWGAVYVG